MAESVQPNVAYPPIDVSGLVSYTRRPYTAALEMYQDPATGREYLFKPTDRAVHAVAAANVLRLLGVRVPAVRLATVRGRSGYWQEWYYGFPDELHLKHDAPEVHAAITRSDDYIAELSDLQVGDFVVRRGDAFDCNRIVDVRPATRCSLTAVDLDLSFSSIPLPSPRSRGGFGEDGR